MMVNDHERISKYHLQGMPQIREYDDISYNIMYIMSKTSNKAKSAQKNKNNKKMPENSMKKQYLESFQEMNQELKYDSN